MKIKNKILLLILITIIFVCEFQSEKMKIKYSMACGRRLSPFYLNAYGDPKTPSRI